MLKASVKKPGDGGEYESDGERGDGDGVPQSDSEPVGGHCISNDGACIDEPCHTHTHIRPSNGRDYQGEPVPER